METAPGTRTGTSTGASAGTPTGPSDRSTYVLVDGENIDATLGSSILGRRPESHERPRWDRLLTFAQESWPQPAVGLFFLAVNGDMPLTFVQALLALGYRPVPLSGGPGEKVVDIAIQRTLVALRDRPADVMLVSHDGDFVPQLGAVCDGRRVALVGFKEFRSKEFAPLAEAGLQFIDLELDVGAFTSRLPRVRVIPIEDFDPADFL